MAEISFCLTLFSFSRTFSRGHGQTEIMGVVLLSFLVAHALDTKCRLSSKVESMSSIDFSIEELEFVETFPIGTSAATGLTKVVQIKVLWNR